MYNISKDDFIILNNYIYGLIHVVKQYYKKANEILKKSGFLGGNDDPCLYLKKSGKGIVYVALNIDDDLIKRDIEVIYEVIAALKENGLILKIVEGLKEHLSCKVRLSGDKKQPWLGQPHLIEKLEGIESKSEKS